MFVDQQFAQSMHVFGFGIEQADGFDVISNGFKAQSIHFFRGVGDFEKVFGGFVDANISGLSGEDDSDEESEDIDVVQFTFWLWIEFFKSFKKCVAIVFFHGIGSSSCSR